MSSPCISIPDYLSIRPPYDFPSGSTVTSVQIQHTIIPDFKVFLSFIHCKDGAACCAALVAYSLCMSKIKV